MSHQYHVLNKHKQGGNQDRLPKPVRPYCRTNLSYETKSLLCDHIVAPITRLILKQQKSEIRNWCDHNVAPIPRFKQKQQCETKISSQTILSHQLYFETKLVLCDHIVAPFSRLKIKQQRSEICNRCDHRSRHQFHVCKQKQHCVSQDLVPKTVRPYCRTKTVLVRS